jgi:hypothetical protein
MNYKSINKIKEIKKVSIDYSFVEKGISGSEAQVVKSYQANY